MKGLIRGAAGLAVLLALSACANDETIALMGPPTGVQATPASAFTSLGDSVSVVVRLVNDRNQSVPASFVISNVGPALTVFYDTKYRPDYTQGDTLIVPEIKTQQRYFAKGAANGTSTFTLTSGSLSTTVTVVVLPKNLGAALNKTTGVVAGDTVTITAPAGLKFTPASVVTFATGPIAIASRAADSSSIKVILGPGTGGVVTVTNILMNYAPTLALRTLVSTNSAATTPAVTVAPSTVSNLAPNIGVPITVSLGAGLRFLGTAKIFIGGREAGLQSLSADSSTATVMPMMGSTGTISYTNIALSFLTSVPLALNGDKNITVSATYGGASDPNAGTIGAASTVAVPPVGRSFIYSDAGPFTMSGPCGAVTGDGCRFYKFVLAGPGTYDLEFRWQGTSDMGLYRVNSVGGSPSSQSGCDNGGQGANAVETCSVSGLAAGTYFFTVTFFGTGSGYPPSAATVPPAFFQWRMTSK